MILLQLFLLKGLLYALIAIPIRVSLALTRGFDLGVAAFTLLAAETLLFACTRTSPPVAFIVVLIFTVLVTLTWYWLTNRVFSDDERGPTRILIAGLGLSGLASGLSGVLGGPGLRLPDLGVPQAGIVPGSFIFAGITCAIAMLCYIVWASRRSGLGVRLMDQNRRFAYELGYKPTALSLPAGLVAGVSAASAGAGTAAIQGVSPSLGLQAFLIGAAAALLFRHFGFSRLLLAGIGLAAVEVLSSYFLSPALANFPLFLLVFFIIFMRGLDRVQAGDR